jgi:hypothetical protein
MINLTNATTSAESKVRSAVTNTMPSISFTELAKTAIAASKSHRNEPVHTDVLAWILAEFEFDCLLGDCLVQIGQPSPESTINLKRLKHRLCYRSEQRFRKDHMRHQCWPSDNEEATHVGIRSWHSNYRLVRIGGSRLWHPVDWFQTHSSDTGESTAAITRSECLLCIMFKVSSDPEAFEIEVYLATESGAHEISPFPILEALIFQYVSYFEIRLVSSNWPPSRVFSER